MAGATPQQDRSRSLDTDDRASATKAKGMWFVLAVAALFAAAALTLIYWPKQLTGATAPPEAPPILDGDTGK